jgi:hypothetical protein
MLICDFSCVAAPLPLSFNGYSSGGKVTYLLQNFHQAVGRLPVAIVEEQLRCRPNAVQETGIHSHAVSFSWRVALARNSISMCLI